MIHEKYIGISKYALKTATNQRCEGWVIKNYNRQIMCKIVLNEFKEKNAEVFGGNPKYNKVDDTNNAEFVFKYCTNARIDKHIFKLLDEGKELSLKLMADLPRNVYNDIIEENWNEILTSNWKLDLPNIRKLIPKRCLGVLQQVIINNSLK